MPSKVFVGSASESLSIAHALQANLEMCADVRIWNQDLFQVGNCVLEDLLKLAHDFDYAIFIWSADDMLKSKGANYYSPRDNVILETGIFYGVLGRERVFLIIPTDPQTKVPSDLLGINQLYFRVPADGNYQAALGPASRTIQKRIESLGSKSTILEKQIKDYSQPTVFNNLSDASGFIKSDCKAAQTISVLANKGLVFFGTDESIISTAELDEYKNLRKLRIILLGEDSRWIHEGYSQLRAYESLEAFKKELRACHEIVESSMKYRCTQLKGTKSGVRYHRGEPQLRFLLTDQVAYVSSYSEPPSIQVRDLPVYRFKKEPCSLYGALKRYFDDIWHNSSFPGTYQLENIDLETSAGGIVIAECDGCCYVVLLQRDDGYWVLPKGHKVPTDMSTEVTALREISEETGLKAEDIQVEKYLGCYGFDETAEALNTKKLIHIYFMRYKGESLPDLNAIDHAEARWWRIDEALPNMLYTYQKSFLHEVIQYLRK